MYANSTARTRSLAQTGCNVLVYNLLAHCFLSRLRSLSSFIVYLALRMSKVASTRQITLETHHTLADLACCAFRGFVSFLARDFAADELHFGDADHRCVYIAQDCVPHAHLASECQPPRAISCRCKDFAADDEQDAPCCTNCLEASDINVFQHAECNSHPD